MLGSEMWDLVQDVRLPLQPLCQLALLALVAAGGLLGVWVSGCPPVVSLLRKLSPDMTAESEPVDSLTHSLIHVGGYRVAFPEHFTQC